MTPDGVIDQRHLNAPYGRSHQGLGKGFTGIVRSNYIEFSADGGGGRVHGCEQGGKKIPAMKKQRNPVALKMSDIKGTLGAGERPQIVEDAASSFAPRKFHSA